MTVSRAKYGLHVTNYIFPPRFATAACFRHVAVFACFRVYLWLTEVNVWERSLSLCPTKPLSPARICLRAPLSCWRVPFAACSVQVVCLVVPTLPFHSPSPSSHCFPLSPSQMASASVTKQRARYSVGYHSNRPSIDLSVGSPPFRFGATTLLTWSLCTAAKPRLCPAFGSGYMIVFPRVTTAVPFSPCLICTSCMFLKPHCFIT